MTISRAFLAAWALAALPALAGATTFVFRNTKDHDAALGMLNTQVGDWGQGILVFEGYRFRLTGFDSWKYTWMGNTNDAQMCLIIHPEQPWIMGFVVWWGDWGVFDIFSTDGVRFEGEVSVQCMVGEPRNQDG